MWVPVLSEAQMERLLGPYLAALPEGISIPETLYQRLIAYLELLVRWNLRTNLTAVRDPEQIVGRHFGESLFAGAVLAGELGVEATVLDLGSGAGFPGIPMQILVPEWCVTLAESQGKKAAFLREVVRVLELRAEVWAGRVESMEPGRTFGAVVMRAVDKMEAMEAVGRTRLQRGGVLLRMTAEQRDGVRVVIPGTTGSFVELSRPV